MVDVDECVDCELVNCIYGFSNVFMVFYIFFCLICGFLVIGGNLVFLMVFFYSEMICRWVNIYFILLLIVVDLFIGLIMILLYICYVVIYDLLWFVKFEGFFWIVIVIVIMYSLSVVSLDCLILVLYFLCYY